MPGVIMENGERDASHTNHDRDQRPNGVNGGAYVSEKSQDKGKGRAEPQQNITPTSPSVPNGVNGAFAQALQSSKFSNPPDLQEQMNQLPPEIAHITEGYVSLATLLERVAVKSHVDLSRKIEQLAAMPGPSPAVNGNSSHSLDDNSPENVTKKVELLKFIQNMHSDWVKALVITNWSSRSADVSKTIDLRVFLDQQKAYYQSAIHEMMEIKRDLPRARVPNPDLKTAIQILSTGRPSSKPDPKYIPPPPLTAREVLKTIENLNTNLSMRMNLQEYDKTPLQFKNYTIRDGRVVFSVAGEFEIDLMIADEDPEKQFWFIDFRFLFSPTVRELPPHLRFHIEQRVNTTLLSDGLTGCYKLLHEMVLTHKISEFRKQAFDLARGKWIEGLKVEVLNRALSVQYWVDRYGQKGPKSWIILGVHSGRRKDGRHDPKATSRLFLRWFRDGKEVKDVDIPFDTVNICTETLLKTVIGMHIRHILEATHEKLQARPLYAKGEMALSLNVSSDEPSHSELKVQLTSSQHLSVWISPITGRILFGPFMWINSQMESNINTKTQDPAKDAANFIEMLRCETAADEITNHGMSIGWMRIKKPYFKTDDLKSVFPKETVLVAWFQWPGWKKEWFFAASLSMSGERWWLIESTVATTTTVRPNAPPPELKFVSFLEIPLRTISPLPTYKFLSTLSVFAAAMASHYTNLKELHDRRIRHILKSNRSPSSINIPPIYIRLSELIEPKRELPRKVNMRAKDILRLTFQGLEPLYRKGLTGLPSSTPQPQPLSSPDPKSMASEPETSAEETAKVISEARMVVPVPASFKILKEKVDEDIAFHMQSGTFAFRLRSVVGEPVISALVERAIHIENLIEFVEVLHKHEKTLKCENISLGKIVFSYGSTAVENTFQYEAVVNFAAINTMTLSFKKGNPHLRIADHLSKILNAGGGLGLDGVANLLPLTLPALRGLETIEAAWTPLTDKGEALVFVRAVEWYILRYNLFSTLPESPTRKVMFEIKLQQRRGEPWWLIRRIDSRDKEGDDIDAQLKPIWISEGGQGWKGMRVNAVAELTGVEELMAKVDDVLRDHVSGTQTGGLQAAPQPQRPAPVAPMANMGPNQAKGQRPNMQNPPRQQPTPQQSQSSQGRGNAAKRPIKVEIDLT